MMVLPLPRMLYRKDLRWWLGFTLCMEVPLWWFCRWGKDRVFMGSCWTLPLASLFYRTTTFVSLPGARSTASTKVILHYGITLSKNMLTRRRIQPMGSRMERDTLAPW
uniref:Uncharacterized protein n=1 Tax=Cacopsylla melanoneura TaxID=428564 RepID=A0A8D8X6P4_9HEMI